MKIKHGKFNLHYILYQPSINDFHIPDWQTDFSVKSEKYKFHYKGEKYKIFTDGQPLEINGWISGQRYTPDQLFYLAVHSSLCDKVKKWGDKECNECKELKDFTGLQKNWHLFKIKGSPE